MKNNLLKELKKEYSVFQSTRSDTVYGVWKDKFNGFIGSVEKREDGWHFCPFDAHLERVDRKITTVEDFNEAAYEYARYWEEYGLTTDIGGETLRHCYRLDLALSQFLDNISGKETKEDYGMDRSVQHSTVIDGVTVIHKDGVDENSIEVDIHLGAGRFASESFTDIPKMMNFVGGVLGIAALEKTYPLLGAIDKLSKMGCLSADTGDVVVSNLNLATLGTEKCTLRDYMIEKLEEGIKALKQQV